MMDALKPGDYAAVVSPVYTVWGSTPPKKIEVARVTSTLIVLTNGSRWNAFGQPVPRAKGFHIPHIEVWTAKHDEEVLCSTRRATLRQFALEAEKCAAKGSNKEVQAMLERIAEEVEA